MMRANNFINPKFYARWTLWFANKWVLQQLESRWVFDREAPLRHSPIFFLGAPRSGSTLAVQAITEALDVGYISNHHCHWYGAPALAERLFHPTKVRPTSDFMSLHGDTNGIYAPAECGEWWYRFFQRSPAYVSLAEVDPQRMLRFRRSIAALTNAFDRPILFKNLYASLRIQAIAHYLPESLFIVMHRNEVDNGHSLLATRKRVFGCYERWWSMEPPEVEQLKSLPAHQQVIEQIRHIHAVINRDMVFAQVPPSRRFDLHYEQFCAAPRAVIHTLQDFLARNNCDVARRVELPASFPCRQQVRIDHDLYKAMADYARRA